MPLKEQVSDSRASGGTSPFVYDMLQETARQSVQATSLAGGLDCLQANKSKRVHNIHWTGTKMSFVPFLWLYFKYASC